jgi:hypothetical protein
MSAWLLSVASVRNRMRKREKEASVPNCRNLSVCPHVSTAHLLSSCRRDRFTTTSRLEKELSMDGIIYLVGLIVIVMFILSAFGLR